MPLAKGEIPLRFIKSLGWSKPVVLKVLKGSRRQSKSASSVCSDMDMRIRTDKQLAFVVRIECEVASVPKPYASKMITGL
jgi:hypothetical protein